MVSWKENDCNKNSENILEQYSGYFYFARRKEKILHVCLTRVCARVCVHV